MPGAKNKYQLKNKGFWILIVLLALLSPKSKGQCVKNPVDFSECSFTAIAHRGYSEFYPENTLTAIEEAFKRGIMICEIDVAITADDVYVLHHDPYTISRTTNGSGTVAENTLAQLSAVDAGFWKATYFENTPLPTLHDALLLAQKYNGILYLDIKDYDAELLVETLQESGVDSKHMLPAITSMNRATEYNELCPECNWVWFGGAPDSVEDDNWYTEKTELGCRYFEFSASSIFENVEWYKKLIERAHEHGTKVWAYTVNNELEIEELVSYGLDGVETDRPYVAQLKLCGYEPVSTYPKNETTGNWNFELGDFSSTGVGSNLRDFCSDTTMLQNIEWGSTEQFGIQNIEGVIANVAYVPAYDSTNGLFVYDNYMMEDSGAVDFSYSVIMDILISDKDSGKYIALIQTNADNLNDADFFINPEGKLGTIGDYHGNFQFNEWQRIIFVLHENIVQKYVNGEFIGETEVYGKRWTVFNNMAYHGKHGFLMFTDNDDETAEIYVNAVQIRNYALSQSEAAILGKPDAKGIPMNNAKLFSTGIADLDDELIDWERKIVFVQPSSTATDSEFGYNLHISHGAIGSKPITGVLNREDGKFDVEITSEDGSKTSNWSICWEIPTFIHDSELEDKPEFYPNPCNNILFIKSPGFGSYTVANTFGQVLMRKTLHQGKQEVDVAAMPSGLYFITFHLNSNSGYSQKFIIRRQ